MEKGDVCKAAELNRCLQRKIKSRLVDIDLAIQRLASLRRYIANVQTSRGYKKSHRQPIFSLLLLGGQKSDRELRKRLEEKCKVVPCRFLYDMNSSFWEIASKELDVSKYTCYNIWINEISGLRKDSAFTKEEDKVLQSLPDKGNDWVQIGLDMQRQPFAVIRRFKIVRRYVQKTKWSKEEDERLRFGIEMFGSKMWKRISEHVATKTERQCLHRSRTKQFNMGCRNVWSEEEDKRLVFLVEKMGKNWSKISRHFLGRTDANCRERYVNVLDPELRRECWSSDEDKQLMRAVEVYGRNKWSLVCKEIKGRNNKQCRRRYYQILKK
eukprot:jgi/Antlo1/370/300